MDSWAPSFCTVRDEALVANSTASSIDLFSERATQRAPQKVSPAAVVSTACTFLAGTSLRLDQSPF